MTEESMVKKNKKKGTLILAIVAAVIVASIILGVIFYKNNANNPPELPPVVDQQIENISQKIAEVNGFEDFDYEFLTASYVEDHPTIHLNGSTTMNGQEQDKILSYTVEKDVYESLSDLEILVTKDKEGKHNFANEYVKYDDTKQQAIKTLILDIADNIPESIVDMTEEQKKDYIISCVTKKEYDFVVSNFQTIGKKGHSVEHEFDVYIQTQNKQNGKYTYDVLKYSCEQFFKEYDGPKEEHPAYVDGKYVFVEGKNPAINLKKINQNIELTADEVLDVFISSKEHYPNRTFKYIAVIQMPGVYHEIVDYFAIRDKRYVK